jgi:hypothetical protein
VDHACAACLVRDELSELGEGPGVERDPLGLAEPYPLPDAAQVFQGDSGRGAFSLGHDRLRDDVVGAGDMAPLAPVALLQQPFGGLRALALELGA